MNWEFWKGAVLFAVVGPPLAVYLAQGGLRHPPATSAREVKAVAQLPGEVLHFYRVTCPVSMDMEARVIQLRIQGYPIRSINTQRDKAAAKAYAIDATPTLIYKIDGREVHRFRGEMSVDSLKRFCRGEQIAGSY